MPQEFDACRSRGGRIRTKSLKGDKYFHICFDKEGSHAGYVKTKGKKGK